MRQSFKNCVLTLIAGVMLIAAAAPAYADPRDWHNNNNRNYHANDNRGRFNGDRNDNRWYSHDQDYNRDRYVRYDRPNVIVFNNNDRFVIRDYYRGHPVYTGHSRRYLVGAPLPYGVRYYPVPRNLLVQLRPVPIGYEYVRVDNDVLLMSLATREILDAVTLLTVTSR